LAKVDAGARALPLASLIGGAYVLVSLLFKRLRTVSLMKFTIAIESTRAVIVVSFPSIPFIFKDIVKKSRCVFTRFKRSSGYNDIGSSMYICSGSYVNPKL
jgi:hypothetical protein